MAPVFYTFPISFNGSKTCLALLEKEIVFETRNVNILLGQGLTAEYLKLNPHGTVPTLTLEDGTIISDSTDIIKWAEAQGSGPLGGDQADRSKIDAWIQKLADWNGNLFLFANQPKGIANTLNQFKLKVVEARKKQHPELSSNLDQVVAGTKQMEAACNDPAAVQAQVDKLTEMIKYAESELSQTKYVAGNAFSMADVMLMTALNRVEVVGKQKEFIVPYEKVSKWWAECKKRPSYKKAIAPTAGPGALPTLVGTMGTIMFKNLFRNY